MSLTNLIDMALIQRLLQSFRGLTEAQATSVYGNYTSLCVPLFNMPPYLIYPISYSIVPMIKTAVASGDKKRAALVMESSLRVAVIIGIPCGLGMAALAEPILNFFGYRHWSVVSAAPLLTLLAPSTFFICVLSVTNAILQANGYERKPVISMLAGAGVKILTNTILIRFIGMTGTPISTFLCYLTATALNIYFIVKHVGLKFNFGRIFLRPLLCGILCAVTAICACNVTSYVIADDVKYGYEVVKSEDGEYQHITSEYNSAYLHNAYLMEDGSGYDIRSELKVTKSVDENENEILVINDLNGEVFNFYVTDENKVLVDGEECPGAKFYSDEFDADLNTNIIEITVPSSGNTVKIFEANGEYSAEIREDFTYSMSEKGQLSLTYPGRNNGTVKLRYTIDGESIYLNDSISRTATILSIGAAAVVYFLFIFVFRAITSDDVKLLPKGEKIEKILRKVKLIA